MFIYAPDPFTPDVSERDVERLIRTLPNLDLEYLLLDLKEYKDHPYVLRRIWKAYGYPGYDCLCPTRHDCHCRPNKYPGPWVLPVEAASFILATVLPAVYGQPEEAPPELACDTCYDPAARANEYATRRPGEEFFKSRRKGDKKIAADLASNANWGYAVFSKHDPKPDDDFDERNAANISRRCNGTDLIGLLVKGGAA